MGSAPLIWGPPIGQRRKTRFQVQISRWAMPTLHPAPDTPYPLPIHPSTHPPIHPPLPPQTHDATAILCPDFCACRDARAGHYPDQD
ncbi:hypothetical protein [Leptolyngbya sp. KIOST-1]|uniref:hypothetical protein n=1 Tax=Leptolyngbya sp. KIOST-1 TaxID=1229172 RepID=UPI0012E05652|nr:hypothetical protein [Leptolyngbya sp. KIOST-1]